jgi:hypothetical protein
MKILPAFTKASCVTSLIISIVSRSMQTQPLAGENRRGHFFCLEAKIKANEMQIV